jgi:hypothetical protein
VADAFDRIDAQLDAERGYAEDPASAVGSSSNVPTLLSAGSSLERASSVVPQSAADRRELEMMELAERVALEARCEAALPVLRELNDAEIIGLHNAGASQRDIAGAMGVSQSTAGRRLTRLGLAGRGESVTHPIPQAGDIELDAEAEEVDPDGVEHPEDRPRKNPPAATYTVLAAKVKKELPALGRIPPREVWKLRLVDGDGQARDAECRKRKPRSGPPTFAPKQKVHGRIKQGRFCQELVEAPEPNRRRLANLVGGMVGKLAPIDADSAAQTATPDAELAGLIQACLDDERAIAELRDRLEREQLIRRSRRAA